MNYNRKNTSHMLTYFGSLLTRKRTLRQLTSGLHVRKCCPLCTACMYICRKPAFGRCALNMAFVTHRSMQVCTDHQLLQLAQAIQPRQCRHKCTSYIASAIVRSQQPSDLQQQVPLQQPGCQQQQQRVMAQDYGSVLPHWYDQQHPQALQTVLQLPSWRFQQLIQQEPRILGYQASTLQLTIEALRAALHCNHRSVVGIIEQRPALLLQPQDAADNMRQLSSLVSKDPQHTAFLLAPHLHLLAMHPAQLQQHILHMCSVMHWPSSDLQAAAAVARVAPASFLQLLAIPSKKLADCVESLAAALESSPAVAGQLVRHHPALLNMSPAVLRSRLFAIAQANGSSVQVLMCSLDEQQVKGLSGLLLLSPQRLTAQLHGLQMIIVDLQQRSVHRASGAGASSGSSSDGPLEEILDNSRSYAAQTHSESSNRRDTSHLAARLLLRLGNRVSLADAQVKLATLQAIVRKLQPWHVQLACADDEQLAQLFAADHHSLAQAKYVAAVHPMQCKTTSLLDIVQLPGDDFRRMWPKYEAWLSGVAVH